MKNIVLLASVATVLVGCSSQTNDEDVTTDTATPVSAEQEANSDEVVASYRSTVQNFIGVTTEDITNKVNSGDAFYLFIGDETSQNSQVFAPKVEEASGILENAPSDLEQEIYFVDLTNESDQQTMDFTDKYNIDTVPDFHYFEGQIYHSAIEDIDSDNITVEEIQDFMSFPYYDEHVTTAPDISIDN